MIKQFCLNTFKTSLDKLSKNVFTYLQANGFYKSFIEAFASSHAKDITTEKKPESSGTKAQQCLEQPTRNTLTFRPLLKQRIYNLPNIKVVQYIQAHLVENSKEMFSKHFKTNHKI